ncbi:putative phosphatidylinositol-4-phosphate 5-kinase [Planoprotostelium fungivorum]|uniref:Putative phosphatidylinositol-4-phosphate 5-kinase n=1 Tax=Planoprotostelium fungivorum TaxID=1890364 RepID=A0A2P6NR41_9EUKA|nr:putative phosphatidylinositol-4-phosphate 5-kinase [Planoprotostelium fungivorum]
MKSEFPPNESHSNTQRPEEKLLIESYRGQRKQRGQLRPPPPGPSQKRRFLLIDLQIRCRRTVHVDCKNSAFPSQQRECQDPFLSCWFFISYFKMLGVLRSSFSGLNTFDLRPPPPGPSQKRRFLLIDPQIRCRRTVHVDCKNSAFPSQQRECQDPFLSCWFFISYFKMLGVLRSSFSGLNTFDVVNRGGIRSSDGNIPTFRPVKERGIGEEASYHGLMEEGHRHGIGKLVWRNGDSYYGTFKYDMKEGFGFMSWTNGDSYEGYWKMDQRHGSAKHRYANGMVFEGTYLHDKRDGPGKLTWPNGDVFIGSWKDNGRVGPGTLMLMDGQHIEQEWNEMDANYSASQPERTSGDTKQCAVVEDLIDLNFDGCS